MLPKQILQIPPSAWDSLASLRQKLGEGSSGQYEFGVGYKRTSGKILDQLSLIVYVLKKVPKEQVPSSQLVPTVFEGFPTDVVECQKKLLIDNKRYGDIHGGIEIGTSWKDDMGNLNGGGAGTLGCIAQKRQGNQKVFLTCEHVVSRWINNDNQHDGVGKSIYQPSLHSPYNPREIGICTKVNVPLDAAIIEPPDDSSAFDNILATIEEIGPVKGKFTINKQNCCLNPSTVGIVSKRGKSTGLTHGVVIAFTTPSSDNPMAVEILSINAALGIPFADFGDSGSAVLNSEQKVIGILTSINPNPLILSAYAVLIDPICDELGIDIVVDP